MDTQTNAVAGADYVVIASYFLVMLGIGIYFSKRAMSIRDFFGGGGKVPWWLSGTSFYMNSFSAFAFVAYSELAYKYGWAAITVCWMVIPAVLLSAYFFAARWRRAATVSALEFIEKRYGASIRQALAWLTIPLRTIDNSLRLVAIGAVVSVVIGFDLRLAIIFSGTIVLAYTFLGGLWAVLVTDFVQAMILLVPVIILLPLAYLKVGGISQMVEQSPPGFFSLTTETFNVTYLLAFIVILFLNYSSSWAMVQRYYSVESDSDARKVGYLVAALQVFGPPVMFLPAMAASVFVPEIADTKQVYGLLCRALLPVGLLGMVVSAMFAATMSSVAGEYNSVAAVMTNDVYRKFFPKKATDKSLVVAGRIATLLIGTICMGIALYISQGDTSLFEIMVKIFSIFIPPIALPMLAGLLNKKVSNGGAICGMLLGMALGLVAFFLAQKGIYPVFGKMQIQLIVTVSSSLIGMAIGTYIWPSSAAQIERIDEFFAHADVSEVLAKKEEGKGGFSTLPIIGFSVGLLGAIMTVSILATVSLSEGLLGLAVGVLMMIFGVVLWTRGRAQNKTAMIEE